MRECDCYVKRLDGETRFALHYGAHDELCPVWRESMDLVDRANDIETRERLLRKLPVQ